MRQIVRAIVQGNDVNELPAFVVGSDGRGIPTAITSNDNPAFLEYQVAARSIRNRVRPTISIDANVMCSNSAAQLKEAVFATARKDRWDGR